MTTPKRKALTPAQIARRQELAERTRIMSERGVPQPKSGTFGGKPKAEKK